MLLQESTWLVPDSDTSLIVFKKNTDTQLGVQQDRVGPAPTVFGPLTGMLVPQAEKPVASFMKRFLIYFCFLFKIQHNPKPPIKTFKFQFFFFKFTLPKLQYVYNYHKLSHQDYAPKIFNLTYDCGCPTAPLLSFFSKSFQNDCLMTSGKNIRTFS